MAKWNHSKEIRIREGKNDFRDQLKNAADVILVQTQDKYLAGLNQRLGITPSPSIPIEQEQINKQLAWIEKHNEIRKLDFILETNSYRVIEAYNKMIKQ